MVSPLKAGWPWPSCFREAWLDKALATGSFMAGYTNGFDEAIGYLKKADDLSPGDLRIAETQTRVQNEQYRGYVNRAVESNKMAVDMFKLGAVDNMTISFLGEAMGYFLEALRVKPNDPYALQAIVNASKTAKSKGIRWNDPKVDESVREAERTLSEQGEAQRRIQAAEAGAKRLEALRHTLLLRTGELERARQKGGFFARLNIEDLQDEIRKLSAEIQRLERQG